MGTGAEFAIAAMFMTAVGTGISVYGQMQQAQQASQMAAYNQRIQQQAAQIAANNAMIQNEIAMRQTQMMQQQIAAQQTAAMQNAANAQRMTLLNRRASQQQFEAGAQAKQTNFLASQRNAQQAENEAKLVEMQARERARRQRAENEQLLSRVRAKNTKTNLTTEGTPLTIMAETAGVMELGVADAWYESNLRAEALRQKGRISDWQGRTQLWETSIDSRQQNTDQEVLSLRGQIDQQNIALQRQVLNYEMAAAQFQGTALGAQRGIIAATYANDMNAARMTYMQGMNQSNAGYIGAAGTLFSGLGSMGSQYGQYRRDIKMGYYS